MYDYLCSCLPLSRQVVRNGVNRILNYLNSNSMNQQILEEEKCVEEYEIKRSSADKLEQISARRQQYQTLEKEDQEQGDEHLQQEDEQVEVRLPDPSTMTREEYLLQTIKLQLALFRKYLIQEPQDEGFERLQGVADCQLSVFYNQRLSAQSKRLSQYRFEYVLPVSLEEYIELYSSGALAEADCNLSHSETLQRVSDSIEVRYEQYKKVLVVTPRDFLFLRHQELTAQREYIVVATSIVDDKLKPVQEKEYIRGHIILSGTVASKAGEGYTKIKSYLQIDLELTVNPQMIKQPALREIRKYVEKVVEICRRRNPGQEPVAEAELPKEAYPNDSPLMASIEGI